MGKRVAAIADAGQTEPGQGFAPKEEEACRKSSSSRNSSVTGPGLRKIHSLYAFLSTINSVHKRSSRLRNLSVELKGINQIAVRSDIGLTFAVGLRHILRQDPNVIMVGEIRDLETAEIAIRAALTGHLVFSTLHTNDAPSAFTRLIDMGIEPFLVASSVEAVMAQRLVRNICPHCKVEQKVERDYLLKIGFPEAEIGTTRFYRGRGCEECRSLGYQGRTGIYEILILSEALRPLILNRAAASTIAQRAIELGMRTLRVDGWNKVKAGVTTIEEVLRVTQTEEHLSALAGKGYETGQEGQFAFLQRAGSRIPGPLTLAVQRGERTSQIGQPRDDGSPSQASGQGGGQELADSLAAKAEHRLASVQPGLSAGRASAFRGHRRIGVDGGIAARKLSPLPVNQIV